MLELVACATVLVVVLAFFDATVELVVPHPPRVSTKPIAHIRSIFDCTVFIILHGKKVKIIPAFQSFPLTLTES